MIQILGVVIIGTQNIRIFTVIRADLPVEQRSARL